jgi:subtilisin family serine protease
MPIVIAAAIMLFAGTTAFAAPASQRGSGVSAAGFKRFSGQPLLCKSDEVIVKFKPGVGPSGMRTAMSSAGAAGFVRSLYGAPDTRLVRLRPGVPVQEAVRRFGARGDVAYAEPDYLAKASCTPTDPDFPDQWGLRNTGQVIGGTAGTPGADINATQAWNIEKGSSHQIKVAVVDTGADLSHPDLASKLVPGSNFAGISCVDNPAYYGTFGDGTKAARAQSIKGTGDTLTHVGVLLSKEGGPSGDVTVSVRGSLTGSDLASFTVQASVIETGLTNPQRFYGALSSTVFLHSGTTYYLVISTLNSSASDYFYTYAMDSEYAEGDAWVSNPPAPWSEATDKDLYFETSPNGVPHDDNGHGTHVSGIIAAAHNGTGVAGVTAGGKVMPVKALTSSGMGYTSGIAEAVSYAADSGASIISMSLGGPYDAALADAVNYAHGKGLVVFAAAGNDGDTTINYPAGDAYVVGVGSTTNQDQKSSFSDYNPTVDLSAPGSFIYSTMPTYDCMLTITYGISKNYDFLSGTSMATPMASGVAALILSKNPSLSPATVESIMEKNAIDLGTAGRDDYFGYGRIDAYRSLAGTLPQPAISSISPAAGPVGTTVTIKGSDFGSPRGYSYVSFGSVKATSYASWSDSQIKCKVPEIGAGTAQATVTTLGGISNSREFEVTSPTWYLAEGTSDWGFDTYVTIENPNKTEVTAQVTYMTKSGARPRPDVTLPPMSQTVINPRNDIGATDFSTVVVCREGKSIAVDRRMMWTGPGAASGEGHASIGVTSPAKTWYLAEGSSDWGFECWLLIQNPNNAAASVDITYMIEGASPVTKTKSVAANSRASFNMADDIGPADASIKVSASVPVIPERAMYRNNRREGHDSIGTTAPASDYFLAEGTTNWGFTTYVLVQNPNSGKAKVSVTYMTPSGPVEQAPFTMPGKSRKTIKVNDALPRKDFSTKVHADKPIIAERAMYWNNGTGEACHDSIGMSEPHTTFYLPDGETTGGHETWTLVQNPNPSQVKVEISYLTPTGQGNKTFTDKIPANSRKSYFMADAIPAGRASVMVTSKTGGKKIMVERAMYWNSRGAGTDTIGGFSD